VVKRRDAPSSAAFPAVMVDKSCASDLPAWPIAGRLQDSAADAIFISFDRAFVAVKERARSTRAKEETVREFNEAKAKGKEPSGPQNGSK
jgi:hypothetical protein